MISSVTIHIWFALPICAWIACKKYFPTTRGFLIAFVSTLLIGYILYVGAVWITSKEYEYALSKYDLDGNGSFSNEEYTAEAQAAMKKLTNDTGRTFAPIVAAPVTFIWTSFWFLILSVCAWFLKRCRAKRSCES